MRLESREQAISETIQKSPNLEVLGIKNFSDKCEFLLRTSFPNLKTLILSGTGVRQYQQTEDVLPAVARDPINSVWPNFRHGPSQQNIVN